MSPRTAQQYDQIRQEKKRLIMDTALELFAENGYHVTSISKIAKKAGISKGLAYNYFESKQEILNEIIRTGFDSIYSHFDPNHDGVLTKEEFEYFIRKSFQIISENRKFWKLYSSLIMQSGLAESVLAKNMNRSGDVILMLNQFITTMGSKDPEGDLMVISSLIKGAIMVLVTVPDFSPVKQLEERVIKACFRLITTK
jgi:AcrR family transcriptional regulator